MRQGKYVYINLKLDVFDGNGKRVSRATERGPVNGLQVDCETKQIKQGVDDWSGVVGSSFFTAVVEFACR